MSDGRAAEVAAGDRDAVALGGLGDPVGQLEQALVGRLGGRPSGDVGLAGLGAHRGEVGERRGQRLAPDRGQAGTRAA